MAMIEAEATVTISDHFVTVFKHDDRIFTNCRATPDGDGQSPRSADGNESAVTRVPLSSATMAQVRLRKHCPVLAPV
ncbi:hypothetical protein AAFF_G00165670 [Aldrovandia affinis]|uniref:Uncharacterized protein n=1 Tax=Aldrovandia affinis TaxID=143900 RepID=A0AAD7RM77_9TELE|nr:hypothetical protein AAFF_G00165670 [Aldrovandia affinis]